jgi:hypothetical protein
MLFSPSSFWNQRLPADVPIDPHSADYVGSLYASGSGSGYGLNYREWATTVFYAGAGDPKVAFTIDQPEVESSSYWTDLQTILSEVPMPPNARPPGPWPHGDQHMTIYDIVNDVLYGTWRTRKFEVDGPAPLTQGTVPSSVLEKKGWHCQAGFGIKNASKCMGTFDNLSWPGIAGSRAFSETASGLPELGGLITVGEAQRGLIPHALTFTGVSSDIAKSPQFRWPALKTDGSSEAEFAMQEGMIFTLDKSVDPNALFTDPFLRALARAARDYGMVCNDGGGSSLSLNAESQQTVPNSQAFINDPWKGPENKFGSAGAILSKFPGGTGGLIEAFFAGIAEHLQVVDASYRPSAIGAGEAL